MKIIISPAKKMTVDTDSLDWQELPLFLPQAEVLFQKLQSMSYSELKNLWKCNDQIAELNYERLHRLDLRKNLTPALLAYDGIQYQRMAPGVFTDNEFTYLQNHLRILSGFYGLLRPFDGVISYRLEMQAKLAVNGAKDLYAFWGARLAEELCHATDCVVNLASKEYSLSVSRHLSEHIRFVTCIFGEEKDGKVIEKGTLCKMARGEMVRYMAEHQITDVEALKGFSELHFQYSSAYSTCDQYVFLHSK